MMRNVSRPVWRKEIGDVLLCSNAPISYPTRSKRKQVSKGRRLAHLLKRLWRNRKRQQRSAKVIKGKVL